MNVAEGKEMCLAVEKAGVPNMVWYNYRRIPAVTLAKQIIDSGKLGKIFHYRANFLQDWTINADVPQGGAATGDSMPKPLAVVLPATCWLTASTQPSGSTGRSKT